MSQPEDKEYCLDNVDESPTDKERRRKITNFLWCSAKTNPVLSKLSEISYAIRTAKNKALTQTYFHPMNVSYKYFNEPEFTKENLEMNTKIMKTYMDENKNVTPPSWFKSIPDKKLDLFMKLFNVIEVPQIVSSIRRVYTLVDKLQLNISPSDIDDIRYIFQLKHSFQFIDFDEFLYSLASIDLLKRSLNEDKEENEKTPLSETQEIIYSVIVLFAVSASSVCTNKKIMGIPEKVMNFFQCKYNCAGRLNSCLYSKLEQRFKRFDNYESSPYYLELLSNKKIISDCKDDGKGDNSCSILSISNPIKQHMKKTKYKTKSVTEEFMKDLLAVYQSNGCLVATLPDVHKVPIFRELLGVISVFDPICSSNTRASHIGYLLKKYKENAMKFKVTKGQEGIRYSDLANFNFVGGRVTFPKLNSCLLKDYGFKHLTPALYTKAFNHMRDTEKKKKEMVIKTIATKNEKLRSKLTNGKIASEWIEPMLLIYDTYNPSDPSKIHFDPIQRKLTVLRGQSKWKDRDEF